jgi:hypothetical protein
MSTPNHNGGTAFPSTLSIAGPAFDPVKGGHVPAGTTQHYHHLGMSLRDHFAGQCCAAMVSTIRNDADYTRLREIAAGHDLDSVSQFFAREAYKQADAMLAERAK